MCGGEQQAFKVLICVVVNNRSLRCSSVYWRRNVCGGEQQVFKVFKVFKVLICLPCRHCIDEHDARRRKTE